MFWEWDPNTLGVYKCPSGSIQELTVIIRTTYSPRLPRSPIRSIRQVYGDFPFILHYVGTCVERLSKITKISISLVGVATDIRTGACTIMSETWKNRFVRVPACVRAPFSSHFHKNVGLNNTLHATVFRENISFPLVHSTFREYCRTLSFQRTASVV